MTTKVLIVDDDPLNVRLVERVLSGETEESYELATARDGREALRKAKEFGPDLIILDVMMPEMDGYEVCQRLRQDPETAHILILVLTAHGSVESRIKGFQAGADDFLTKPFHPEELLVHIRALLRRRVILPVEPAGPKFVSRAVAFFSLRGGVGTSTFATNVAVALAQLWQTPVVLVDMVLACGQSAMMLNQTLRHTWADLAEIPPQDCTVELVEQALIAHDSGVLTLAAPPSSELAELVTPEIVSRVLELLTSKYEYVIMDLPHDFQGTTLAALDRADQIVLVLTPEIMSVYAAKRALDTLAMLDYADERISLLMNWTFAKGGLAQRSIESALGRSVDYVIPFAESLLVETLNLGVPAALRYRRKPLGAVLEDLAFYLSKPEHKTSTPEHPSETWRSVQERQEQRRKRRRT